MPDTFKRTSGSPPHRTLIRAADEGGQRGDEDEDEDQGQDEDQDEDGDDEGLVDGLDNEREYIVRAPVIHRPSVCEDELQSQVRLAGTMYDARHPEQSMALMAAASARPAVYRSGARLGSLKLLEVRPHAVLVTSDAEESPCWLRMVRSNPKAPPPARAAARPAEKQKKAKRSRKNAFSTEELSAGIQQVGPGVYRVDRSMLDRALARVPKLARTTRTRLAKSRGRTVGVSLRKIAKDGLFEHLGLKRGDVLKTVNGFDMSSIDGMLSAKVQLSNAPRLSVSIARKGVPMTLEYRMQ